MVRPSDRCISLSQNNPALGNRASERALSSGG